MNTSTRAWFSPLRFFPGRPSPRFYGWLVEVLRDRCYRRRTEEGCIHWGRRFVLFRAGAHPPELGEGHINRFLRHLPVKESVAASKQNRALTGLLFLHECGLDQRLSRIEGVVRARKPQRLPGRKGRVTLLPEAMHRPLQDHLRRVRKQQGAGLEPGCAAPALSFKLIGSDFVQVSLNTSYAASAVRGILQKQSPLETLSRIPRGD